MGGRLFTGAWPFQASVLVLLFLVEIRPQLALQSAKHLVRHLRAHHDRPKDGRRGEPQDTTNG